MKTKMFQVGQSCRFALTFALCLCASVVQAQTRNQRIGAYPGGFESHAPKHKSKADQNPLAGLNLVKSGDFPNNTNQFITNFYTGDDWREIKGKTYNAKEDNAFHQIQIEPMDKDGEILIAYKFKSVDLNFYSPDRAAIDKTIAIKNFGSGTAGNRYYIRAMQNGVHHWGTEPVELWDCGKPATIPVVTVNPAYTRKIASQKSSVASAKALAWHQQLADKSDAFGQFEMGQHYLKGDGVEANEAKARDYFTKAAAQGHAQAKTALDKLATARGSVTRSNAKEP